MRIWTLMFSILAAVAFHVAEATPITLIHSGVSTGGQIRGIHFGPGAFTITATADTDNVKVRQNGYSVRHLSATIDIEGVGLLTFITPTQTIVNDNVGAITFSRFPVPDLFSGPPDDVFLAYDLTTAVGP